MAEEGRREVINDPLALNPREREADRSLPTYGVRNPQQTGGDAGYKQGMRALSIIDGLQVVAGRVLEKTKEAAFTNGKIAYMQGATDEEIARQGNKYTTRGYETLKSINTAQEWFNQEALFIQNQGAEMSPEEYQKHLMESRKQALSSIPGDEGVRKAWAASFEDFGPRLASEHVKQHNAYNELRATSEFTNVLMSGAGAYSDKSQPAASGEYRVSMQPVRTPVQHTAYDKEVLIKTVLGEAAGEGQQGMAAVAHVVVNRTEDKRWGGSISKVALEDKQFSAWNKGKGGNNPDKWQPGTEAWRRAEEVVDAVLSGHHVDPTNGAVNYYAPKGMDGGIKPDWATGKGIKVGNHLFEGQKLGSGPQGSGSLVFRNKGQEGINPTLKGILTETSAVMGRDLSITSGYRSPEYNKKVGGAKESEHQHGNASDIDMTGMSDEERTNLVQTLRAKGARRFITYTKSPNMLHVDMSEANGEEWFMYDKSNDNMDKAPEWFKTVASAPRPTENGQAAGNGGSQVQRLIANSPLRGPAKASAVVDAMRRSLDSGDDTLFNDAGGAAVLYALGAKPSEVDEVLKAKDRFDAKKDKEFDINTERERGEILAKVTSGEFPSLEAAYEAVDEFQKRTKISAAEARSLSRSVADKWEKAGEGATVPLELRNLAASLYDQIQTGALDANEAGEKILEYSRANPKVKASKIDSFVADMYSAARSKEDRLRTEAKTAFDKQQKEQQVVNRATQAITQGVGLKGLSGTASIPDPANPGKTKTVTGEEYGIWAIKKATADSYNQQVVSGLDKDQAQVGFYNDVYENLAKQNVYDKEFGNQISAAVHGNVIGDDKQPTPAALKALDFYMQMRDNPEIGIEYLHGMIDDEQARTFLETAANLYDGQQDISTAILRANTILSQTVTPEMKLEKNAAFYGQVNSKLEENVNAITDRSSWLQRIMPFTEFDSTRVQQTVEVSRQQLQNYVGRQAETYHLMNPREPVDVSIKKASADLQRNAVVIGTNVLIGNEKKGTRLDQVMGVTDLGRTAPHSILMEYLDSIGQDTWGELWNQQPTAFGAVANRMDGGTPRPEVQVTYNPTAGTLQVQLYKDNKLNETVGEPLNLDAKILGNWYKNKLRKEQEGKGSLWRGFVDAVATGEQTRRGAEAGSAIGNLFNQQAQQ